MAKPARKGEEPEAKPWNWNATVCKEWREKHADKIIATPEKMERANAAKDALFADEPIKALIECSAMQVHCEAVYVDEATGLRIPVRALIDLVPNKDHGDYGRSLADLKTAESAGGAWSRKVNAFGYHVQAAMFLDIYNAATGEKRNEFRHVVSESYAPFAVGRKLLSAEYVQLGRWHYVAALERYCQCLSADEWPGYDDGDGTMRGWAIAEPEPWMVPTCPMPKTATVGGKENLPFWLTD